MQTRFSELARSFSVLLLVTCALRPQGLAQTPSPALEIETYAGLTITGTVGAVLSLEYVTDLAESSDPHAWRCLEFLQLPASPYLWTDKSASATAKRFYRALAMNAPNMVFIPPGTFRMGSPTNEVDRQEIEGPQTQVTLTEGFWMGKYEVTQGEYVEIIGNNPSLINGIQDGHDYGVDLLRPVESMFWDDANAYCVALTKREQAAGRIPTQSEYRLPTEAEWEYACREDFIQPAILLCVLQDIAQGDDIEVHCPGR